MKQTRKLPRKRRFRAKSLGRWHVVPVVILCACAIALLQRGNDGADDVSPVVKVAPVIRPVFDRQKPHPRVRQVLPAPVTSSTDKPSELPLPQGEALVSGRVEDITGGAVSATITIADVSGTALARTQSDRAGHFELGASPGDLQLIASAEGYADATTWLAAPKAGVSLVLSPASRLSGKVVDREGQGVAGALVQAEVFDSPSPTLLTSFAEADGSFRFSKVPVGTVELWASKEHSLSPRQRLAVGVLDNISGVNLEVLELATLTGNITVGAEPCEAGEYALDSEQTEQSVMGPIEPGGHFRAGPTAPGSRRLQAFCSSPPSEPGLIELDLSMGENTTNLELNPRARSRGSEEPPGQEERTHRLEIVLRGGAAPSGELTLSGSVSKTLRDVESAVVVSELPPGNYVVEDTACARTQITIPSDQELTTVILDGGDTTTLEGSVVDSNGQPVVDAVVVAQQSTMLGGARGPGRHTTMTNSDGTFLFEGLCNRSYLLSTRGPLGTAEQSASAGAGAAPMLTLSAAADGPERTDESPHGEATSPETPTTKRKL